MESIEAPRPDEHRIVIYRTANRDGETFALEPRSLTHLRREFGERLHLSPRVFVAHETRADYEHVHGRIVPQIVLLLTGLSEDELRSHGRVIFVDPVTEQELARK